MSLLPNKYNKYINDLTLQPSIFQWLKKRVKVIIFFNIIKYLFLLNILFPSMPNIGYKYLEPMQFTNLHIISILPLKQLRLFYSFTEFISCSYFSLEF